jgi:hypothetical protein
MGELLAFPLPSTPATPRFSIKGGALHIVENAPATSLAQFPGVILGFETPCLDASAFSGVEFSISGSYSGCALQYATGDAAHQDAASGAPYATGPAGSYQPQATIAATQLGPNPITLKMPFVGGPAGGSPETPVDKTKLIFVLWQFNIDPATGDSAHCVADIKVDDVKLY